MFLGSWDFGPPGKCFQLKSQDYGSLATNRTETPLAVKPTVKPRSVGGTINLHQNLRLKCGTKFGSKVHREMKRTPESGRNADCTLIGYSLPLYRGTGIFDPPYFDCLQALKKWPPKGGNSLDRFFGTWWSSLIRVVVHLKCGLRRHVSL